MCVHVHGVVHKKMSKNILGMVIENAYTLSALAYTKFGPRLEP